MTVFSDGSAMGTAARRVANVLVAVCAIALAGCNQNANLSAAHPRGATVAFESIDGPPSRQFQKLVQSLNEEAQSRRLAVISRDQSSAYRVRGYLAAKVVRDRTTIAWVWDVFDANEQRALRITGEETAKNRRGDAWGAADDAMLQRIARASMDQLAAFVISPDAVPVAAEPASLRAATPADSSPEAAGIYRIFKPRADPVDATGANDAQESPVAAPSTDGTVPRRPPGVAMVSAPETLTLSALSR
jgi:hypothetical protein